MDSLSTVQKIAIFIIPLIFAITAHEAAHGYIANRYGDNTAKLAGRLSLNPLYHIDLVGTIIFPLIGLVFGGIIFGWAKPVPINFAKLTHPKSKLFWVALGGPLANFAMALIWALIIKLTSFINVEYFSVPLNLMGQAGISINISLMILNLLPILPLDGGRIVFALLPQKSAMSYAKIEPYGMWILLLLLLFGGLNYIIGPIYSVLVNFILYLIR